MYLVIGQNQYDSPTDLPKPRLSGHLYGRETAAVVGVADGGQLPHKAGVKLHPPLEFLPGGFGQYCVAIHQRQFHSAIFSDFETLHIV